MPNRAEQHKNAIEPEAHEPESPTKRVVRSIAPENAGDVLDKARQVINCWLESADIVKPIDLTEEGFDAAISADERLNAAFDMVASSAVEQFSAHVRHGRVKLACLPVFMHHFG
jgi:hypothetical protein